MKNCRKYFFIILVITLGGIRFSIAQNSKIDSLLLLLKKDKEDTNKVIHLNQLSFICRNIGNYSEGLKYGNEALTIGLKQSPISKGVKKHIANSYTNIGIIHGNQGNYPEALKNYLSALKIREAIGDIRGIGISYNNLGVLYDDQKNYTEALNKYFASLAIKKQLHDKKGIANLYNNIGVTYMEQAKLILKKSNNIDSARIKLKESLNNHLASLKIKEEINDLHGISGSYNNIALINIEESVMLKKFNSSPDSIKRKLNIALANLLSSLKIREQLGDKDGIATCFINLGEVHTLLNKFPLAKNYYKNAVYLGKELGSKDHLKTSYFALSILDSITGNFELAFDQYKQYIIYSDSLNNEESQKKTIQHNLQYEFEKRETASKLERENKVALTNAEHEKQIAINEANNRRQVIFIWLITSIAIASGIISIIVFRSLRATRKQKLIIEKQKEQIETSHKKIHDSIKYAQKIQYSILPSPEEIKTFIPDYFVLFQPKDIISGDFYWFYHFNNFSYLAVADCTGHGVPGALLSMAVNSLLNEVMMEEKLTNPAEILTRLHRNIYNTLQQHKGDEYSQDGCDISLFVLDHTNAILHFSGARNHAYFTNGISDMVLKATPRSIGGSSTEGKLGNDKKFNVHTIHLNEIDFGKNGMLYLFTDGYVDQKGGPLRKKFFADALKKLLLSICNEHTEKQKEILLETFSNWKGNLEQVDDVLIMGLKIGV